MRDGRTRQLAARGEGDGAFAEYAARWRASIVVVEGLSVGEEFQLDKPVMVVGRARKVELSIDDPAMSKEHAAIEFANDGYRVRDLGSMNGTHLNGSGVRAAELKHGDRLRMGEQVFQFVLEQRERRPRTYVVPEE